MFQQRTRKFILQGRKTCLALQGIIDHRNIFLDYDVSCPGSVHDAKVYRHLHLEIVSAYPLSSFLIKPYNKPNDGQKMFNQIFLLTTHS
ncbi:hypothetical protein RCL_jg7102.t1 [Rhizophagus clarus]|uniref:DDE Tnp4 domain-containing protein n=1 Tax=Rhizophagus clarus TaxID=94130 RepID=A0A8H3M1P1_9GLOM|nr:hypothetical protein RCL_jg7102.t1 [Rhizophagus clarus]